jgi:hypothetical protein
VASGLPKRSCSIKDLERDDDSTKAIAPRSEQTAAEQAKPNQTETAAARLRYSIMTRYVFRTIDFGASLVFMALCAKAFCAHFYHDIVRPPERDRFPTAPDAPSLMNQD